MTSDVVDDMTVETYALLVDQALSESEAVTQKRLSRSDVELIVQRELESHRGSMSRPLFASLVERITRLMVTERGYTSPLSGNEHVLPDEDAEERQSFWRQLVRFKIAR